MEVPTVNAASDFKFPRGIMDHSIFQKAKPKRVLVFMPYSGIWPMQLQTFQLLRNLPKAKYDVFTVSCGKALNRNCAVYESYGQPSQEKIKESLCDKCRKSSLLVNRKLESENLVLNHFVSDTEKERFSRLIAQLDAENLIDFKFEGYEIGRLTSYETLIKFKKIDLNLSPQEESYWKSGIYQGLNTLHAARKILAAHKPDLALIYSPQYVAGSVFASTCKEFKVPVYFLEGSVHLSERYKAMHVWDWEKHGLVDPAIDEFRYVASEPLRNTDAARIRNHLELTEKSKSFAAYSISKKRKFNIWKEFNIPTTSRIVLCALSSHDEIYSGYMLGKIPEAKYLGRVFESQFEWIKHTIKIASKHPDVFFIVRLHPRMWANKREKVVADVYSKWKLMLEDMPTNMAADFPEHRRSIANYFDTIDLLVTGWSSTAIDAMAKGIPTLAYDQAVSWFPNEVVTGVNNKDEYENLVIQKLDEGIRKENIERAKSWLAFRLIRGTIKIPGRVIDRLNINNIHTIEKIYNFCVRYTFIPISRLDSSSLFTSKKNESACLEEMLDLNLNHVFENRAKDAEITRSKNT